MIPSSELHGPQWKHIPGNDREVSGAVHDRFPLHWHLRSGPAIIGKIYAEEKKLSPV